MKVHTLVRRQRVAQPIGRVFAFFADPANLDHLTPPWLRFRILTRAPIEMTAGREIEYSICWRGVPLRWVTVIEEWAPGEHFVDRQARGPYRLWHHLHRFRSEGGATIIEDVVRYALPFGPIGRIAHAAVVRRDIERIFDFRARQITEHFEAADAP